MHTRRLAIALSMFITPAIVHSQQAAPDSMPHAGTWGAEVFLGNSGSGASILRFQSSNVALLFGADFSYSHTSDDDGTIGLSSSGTLVAARLGLRNYRGSTAERLRPVAGVGVRTVYGKGSSDSQTWSAGAYGELGAMYFLMPHISLGGTGEIQASYGKRKQTITSFPNGSSQTLKQNSTTVTASLMRVMLAVYF